jgi:membrane protease YdiL (CAAX protease family)
MRKGSGKPSALKLFFYCGTILIILAAAISIIGAVIGSISTNTANMALTICFSLILSFLVVSYLLSKGKKPKAIIKELGLSRKALNWRTAALALGLFAIYLIIIFAFALFSSLTGIQISSNVQQAIGGYPLWALIFVAVIAPINEEIAFRAFLVPRIGVILSGLVFAVLHFGYGSFAEIAVALWFGLTGGYVFKRTKSLYPSLITHMAVNSLTAISIFVALHYGSAMMILVH